MRIEDVIAHWITEGRNQAKATQAQVGEDLAKYLGRPWSRQAVSAAEKGGRAFTAAELVAFALLFGCTVESLLEPPPGVETVELGDGPGLDARHLRTTAGTNSDLVELVNAVQAMRDHFPQVEDEVHTQRELLRSTARETYHALRGRGIDVTEEQSRALLASDALERRDREAGLR